MAPLAKNSAMVPRVARETAEGDGGGAVSVRAGDSIEYSDIRSDIRYYQTARRQQSDNKAMT
ncbi:hypothetical protein HpMS107_31090 [Helicobacter pylori]